MPKVIIKKGDTVKVIKGKDRGKSGKVTDVDYQKGSVVIDGLNTFKKNVRPKKQGEKGQVVSLAMPIRQPNVMLVCGSCKKASRVGYRITGKKGKERYCKKCNAKA